MRLFASHLQVDEKYSKESKDYMKKIEKALAPLKRNGIEVDIKPTKLAVVKISRVALSGPSDKYMDKLYDELKSRLAECDKSKGKERKPFNVERDAITGLTSIDYDYFLTCDECLSEALQHIFEEHDQTFSSKGVKIPKVLYRRPDPIEVAKAILSRS